MTRRSTEPRTTRIPNKRTAGSLASVPENRRPSSERRGFLLILVVVVIAIASLAALNFSQSMLVSHSTARFSSSRLQARMCAESGLQSVRLFLAYPKTVQIENGGTYDNASMFQALNVIPDTDPSRRGNFTILSPSLDQFGNYSGFRYGLQNESAKLNLNTLAQLDELAASGDMTSSALGGGGAEQGGSDMFAGLASDATAGLTSNLAADILLALPGMTDEIADAILDFLDADEEPRTYGAEFDDYYRELPTPYKPPNGPINSVEQLLLVRGVTPRLLFGYDLNRNGYLDANEQNMMSSGIDPGAAPGTSGIGMTDPSAEPPPPLGWAAYLTIHSEERNATRDGFERININSDDLETLYGQLNEALANPQWASFIIAFRLGGTPGGNGSNPLVTLAQMAAAESDTDGALGEQLGALSSLGQEPQDLGNAQPWTADKLPADLSQGGAVKFSQLLDLFDATVTLGGNGNGQDVTYLSPFSSDPVSLALVTPLIMDTLSTVDAESIPGRINIMECPQEIVRGIPGITDEVAEQILEARVDGSDSETRNFETWLAAEGFLSMDEMRAILPLVTCGGDVYKAQVVGYMEGDAAYSRVEAVISGAGQIPEIKFFRRLDHLGRGFDITTLGQRFDAGVSGGTGVRAPGANPVQSNLPGGFQ